VAISVSCATPQGNEYTFVCYIGLAISDKKLFRGRRNRRNNWLLPAEFLLLRGPENSQNSVPNHSAEEKNARNSLPWNKNRSKLLEFRFESYCGRENNSDFRSLEQKQKQTLGILFRTIPGKENNSEFRSVEQK
jgi:hypothetical protein